MLNRLLRYFYKKVLELYGDNIDKYNQVRLIVYKNFESCINLVDCFNQCKFELL